MKKSKRLVKTVAPIVLAGVLMFTSCVGCQPKSKPDDSGSGTPPVVDVPPPDDTPTLKDPVIYGADDVTVSAGTYYDFTYGVTATSSSGKDITAGISISGEVNTAKAGEYTLTYTVTDENAKTATVSRVVTVTANPEIGVEKPIPVFTAQNAFNIAKGCVSSATHTTNGSAGNAFDGDASSRWESSHGVDDVSLTVDLGTVLPFEAIEIVWEDAYANDFEILISDDGNSYRVIASESGQKLSKADNDGKLINRYDFDEEYEARYVRIHCTKRDTAYGYSIFEFQVFGKQSTVVPTGEYPVLFNAPAEGYSDWAIEDEQWLQIDFGSVKSFDSMELSWSDWKTPLSYDIYVSETEDFENKQHVTLDGQKLNSDVQKNITVSARYVKIELHSRRFTAQGYLVNQLNFKLGDEDISRESYTVTSSSAREDHPVENAKGDYGTFWASEYGSDADVLDYADFSDSNRKEGKFAAKKIDLGNVESVGRVDLYWNGSDGGKGKYYDLQISEDGNTWTTVFRQTHGATRLQSVYVYERARFLRVIDYQSTSEQSFMLEGVVVNSQYPEGSGESKIEYDVSLKFPERDIIYTENGSYTTGGTDFPSSRLIAYLDDSLRDKPVPSNDWWQGLLVADKGYNLFTNPLMSQFKSDGFWMTAPGDGYFSGLVPGNGSQTVNVDEHDVRIGYAGMAADAQVRVTGYSDYGISAVMTDNAKVDKFTLFLSQGALYSYCLFAEPERATVWSNNLVGVYDLQGNAILSEQGTDYTGDCIILCVRAHSGYENGIQKYKDKEGREHQNDKEYEERYYIVNVPSQTHFVRGEDVINVVMQNGNYMSVGALSGKTTVSAEQAKDGNAHGRLDTEEAALMHKHGYAFVVGTNTSYDFDKITNKVTTNFTLQTMCVRSGYSNLAYAAYLPHHTEKATVSDADYLHTYDSIRGDCRSIVGNTFTTVDYFYGVVPTFAEPDDNGYSAMVLYQQLVLLYENNGGSKAPQDSNLISGDPYWQGKNLHPMAMAALAADQIGATDLRDEFLDKIEYILTDWFTYDEVKDSSTGAYFYYDSEWGTLYYKNSEFGAGVNLADHYFTYGYYTLASGVLCAYRPEFAQKFGDMIELLIRDYMNPRRDDDMFPYMRNFDPFAGHGWAGGYADNNSGNNQESAGEALNSWVGAYLYATAVGNEEIRTAAIYGFTTELSAIKHYWFDYYGDFPESYQYGVAGQVYGGSNFYGTFFNGEPLYAYGIHLIPGEEYLTSYALNGQEREHLERLIDNMRKEQGFWELEEAHQKIYAWQHIFIPIIAIYDPDEAIEWYAQTLAEQGNVGNTSEQFNVYWLIHGMKSTGLRTTDIWAENGASATVYQTDGRYKAVCWNPTSAPVRITFRNKNGVVGSALVPACSLVTADPEKVTDSFISYADSTAVKVKDHSALDKATENDGVITFSKGSSAKYLISCGTQENYCKIILTGNLENAKLKVDGILYPLTKTAIGYETPPVVLTFKHEFEICADGGRLTNIKFQTIELGKIDITGASANASTNNGANVAGLAVDGKADTRWESIHGSDDEWIIIELPQAVTAYQLQITWEAASAAEYNVYFSDTGDDWQQVYHGEYSQGARTDKFAPSEVRQVKYIKIEGIRRTTNYGYSIYEIALYGLNA